MPRSLAVLAVLLSIHAHAAGFSRRFAPAQYDALAVAALPRGELAVLTGDSLLVVDAVGAVRGAQSVVGVQHLATSTAGAIFVSYADGKKGIVVRKWNGDLTLAWSRRISPVDMDTGVIAGTSDGGVIVTAGRSSRGSTLTKLKADGTTEWAVTFDGATVWRVRETGDAYAFAGVSRGAAWLTVITKGGRVQWQRTYAPVTSFSDVAPAPDGGLLAAGQAVIRTKADGSVAWAMRMEPDLRIGVIAPMANGYVLAGIDAADSRTVVFALDDAGKMRWQRQMLRPASSPLIKPPETLLAPASGGAAFVSPFTHNAAMLFQLDAATGESGCSWLAASSVRTVIESIAAAPLAVSIVPAALQNEALTATDGKTLTLTASAAPCPAPASEFQPYDETQMAAAKHVLELWAKRDWNGLEAAAAAARKTVSPDPLLPYRDLYFLYVVASETEEEGETLKALREWVAARPQSITARIALAKGLHTAAWHHRSGDEQSSDYKRLLAEANKTLASLGRSADADPYYWQLAVQLAGESGSDIRGTARRGLVLHASPPIAWNAANYLLPMWGGSAEKLLAWAGEAVRITRPVYGEALYFPLAIHLYRNTPADRRKALKIDWARMKRAAEDLIGKNPRWVPTYHDYARAAADFDDRAAARALFQRPELSWFGDAASIWGSRADYDEVRMWALAP